MQQKNTSRVSLAVRDGFTKVARRAGEYFRSRLPVDQNEFVHSRIFRVAPRMLAEVHRRGNFRLFRMQMLAPEQ